MTVLNWTATTSSVSLEHFLTPSNMVDLITRRQAVASPAPGDTVMIGGIPDPANYVAQGTVIFSGIWTAVDFYGLQDRTLLLTNPNGVAGDTVQRTSFYVDGTKGDVQLKLQNSHLVNDRMVTTGTAVIASYLDSGMSGNILVGAGTVPGFLQVQLFPVDTAGAQPDDHVPVTTLNGVVDVGNGSVFWVTNAAAGGIINNGSILVRPGGALVLEDSVDANALTNPFFVPYASSHTLTLGNGGTIDVEGAAGKTTKAAILVNTTGSGTVIVNGNGADPSATSMVVDGSMQGQTIMLADGTVTFQDATVSIDTPTVGTGFDVTGGSFTFADDKGILVLDQAPLTTLQIVGGANGSTVSQQTADGRHPFTTPISGFRTGDVIKLPGKDLAAFNSNNTYVASYNAGTQILSIQSPSQLSGYPAQIIAQLSFNGSYVASGFHLSGNAATQELDLTYSASSTVTVATAAQTSLPAIGAMVSNATLNGTFQAASGVDLSNAPVLYEVDGSSTLQSVSLGSGIELDIGFAASGTLTGSGTISGSASGNGTAPLVDNFGTLDVNGTIGVRLNNDGKVVVSAGERLDLSGDLLSMGTITVAAAGELDLDSPISAYLNQLTLSGRMRSTTAQATLQATANTGTIDITAGTLGLAASVTGTGTIIVESGAKLDMSVAPSVANSIVLASGATLAVAPGSSFTGMLLAPSTGATISLANVGASSATVSNGAIVITTGSATISLGETGLAQNASFAIRSDGAGGSLISLQPVVVGSGASGSSGAASGGQSGSSSGGSSTSGGAPATSTPGTVLPVYRFFDRLHGTHFFTSDVGERNTTASNSFAYAEETNGFGAVAKSDSGATAVYRFFDTRFGTHFFTASATERDSVAATRPDLIYEPGSTFYEHQTQQAGDVPVYRFFDQTSGTHFYTGDQSEYRAITTPGAAGYRVDLKSEGTEFYAPAGSFS